MARGDTVILSKGYGKADLEHGVPATETSVFRIASVTKQFTAAAILRLAERGKLAPTSVNTPCRVMNDGSTKPTAKRPRRPRFPRA